MKKNLLLIGSLILNCTLAVFLIFGLCGKASQKAAVADEPIVSLTTHQDSIVTAIKNIAHFVDKFDSTRNRIVRSYTISGGDMLQVMGASPEVIKNCSYDSCRAYLGYNSNDEFKLYLTPIQNNQDVFLNFKPGKGVSNKPNTSSYVLDLIAPCPNTCDSLSALYTCKMPAR